MEFGIEKCAMLVMKSVKRSLTEGIELTNQDKIRTLAEKRIYTWASWSLAPSKGGNEKRNSKRISQEK